MKTNTRLLFKFLLRHCQIDHLFDIGSCDGYESCLFRQILPTARVIAFEANPVLYQKMLADPKLRDQKIEISPCAISNYKGTAKFHVPDLDYDDKAVKNPGTGSLLVHTGLKVREDVEVPTRRIDEYLLTECPGARNVALWIDAEGAEFEVLDGMRGIQDRVKFVQVETSRTPIRVGQKVYAEVEKLMRGMGFVALGDDLSHRRTWGDVVFVHQSVLSSLGIRFRLCQLAGWVSYWCRANEVGGFLKTHCGPIYRVVAWIYVKLFT